MAPTVSSTVAMPPAPAPQDSTKIVVREFRPEDLPQVTQLFKQGMLNYPKNEQDPRLLQFIDDSLKTDLKGIEGTYVAPDGNYWIATPRDESTLVVGMVGLEAKPNNEGELRRMSVKGTHRRYGAGRLLLPTLEQWAAEHQFLKIWLTTGSVMAKAREFHISVGYEQTGVTVVSEDPYFEAYTFEKMLGGVAAVALEINSNGTTVPP